ncbi:MAG: hypothetical protein PHR03_08940 [Desulfovibrionales bacterium]|nr:hypothetical protein [Desulfovibrionales bacterium]
MSSHKDTTQKSINTRRRKRHYICHACGKELPFCWTCRCGFQICPACMEENMWGLSCNAVTWICPDCGDMCVF